MINFHGLQAVIWDMDGVLVDSEGTHLETLQTTFEKFNMPMVPESLKHAFGMTTRMVIEMMVDSPIAEDKMADMCAEKARLFQQAIAKEAKIFPGVPGWLDSFRQNNVSQAVASSGSPKNIAVILEKLEITDYFDVVVSGEGAPSKPDPHIFLKAANRLNVSPLNCLVIEDSAVGVKAAKAAGMQCIAVMNTSPREYLEGADIILENLTQLMSTQVGALFSI